HPRGPLFALEWKGVDFLPSSFAPVKAQWAKFWPQTGNVPNWDAVGLLRRGASEEWVLIEAKAHTNELFSRCAAKNATSLKAINDALSKAKLASDAPAEKDWLRPYYQFANRLA